MSADSKLATLNLADRWWERPQIPAPRPWRISGVSANPGEAEVIVDANGNPVAWTANTAFEPARDSPAEGSLPADSLEGITPENRANARHLVRAINHHPALCALNELVIRTIGDWKKEDRQTLGLDVLYAKAMLVFDAVNAEPAEEPIKETRWITLSAG
jgi:hypothetical protein